jgi:hypothetical protein
MRGVVIDSLFGDGSLRFRGVVAALIHVARELGKRTRRHLQAQLVAFLKFYAGRPRANGVLIDLAWNQEVLLLLRFAEASADNAIVQPLCKAIGMHIQHLDCPVGVSRRGGSEQLNIERAADFGRLLDRSGRVHHYVIPALDGAIVIRAASLMKVGRRDKWSWIVGVVAVVILHFCCRGFRG